MRNQMPARRAREARLDRLRRIEMLAHAAEAGSFSRAAAALHVDALGGTTGIAELEARLGATLFHRTTRQLRLTRRARPPTAAGGAVIDSLGVFEATGRTGPAGAAGRNQRIVATGPISRLILLPRIGEFLRRIPSPSRVPHADAAA